MVQPMVLVVVVMVVASVTTDDGTSIAGVASRIVIRGVVSVGATATSPSVGCPPIVGIGVSSEATSALRCKLHPLFWQTKVTRGKIY